MAKATRDAYGEELAELVKKNDKVVVLDADLASSTRSKEAQKVAPERFFDMGIAEQNMIGTAAGFAASGYIPFASSFAMFATGRCWEQIRNSVAYPHLNVKVVGTHGGIAVGEDGVTHQAIEDIAIMRSMTRMEVYVPCDQYETKAVIDHVANTDGPCYVRLGRSAVEDIYSDKNIDVDRIHVLREGKDVAAFACGLEVQESLKAAELLKDKGIDLTVVDVCKIKEADVDGIKEVLKNHKHIFTCEEHSIIGGLGSLICEVACEYDPHIVHRIGMTGFGESGDWQTLLHHYELDAEGIANKILSTLR